MDSVGPGTSRGNDRSKVVKCVAGSELSSAHGRGTNNRELKMFYFSHFSLFESLNYFWRGKYYFSKPLRSVARLLLGRTFFAEKSRSNVRPNYPERGIVGNWSIPGDQIGSSFPLWLIHLRPVN